MANVKISELPIAASVDGASSFPVVEGGVTKQVTFTGMLASPSLFASGMATFFATPSSANLRAALTDETGTGAAVFADSPTLTGAVSVTGTVAATKLIPTGNVTAGNGMYLPAANEVAISTNGTEQVRVNAVGDVTFAGDLFLANANALAWGAGDGSTRIEGNSSTDVLTLFTVGAERVRVDASGNMLVGSTAQVTSELFLVAKANGTNFVQRIWNSSTTGDNAFIVFTTEAAATDRGGITYNRAGGLISYNTTSDYRAKNILGPVANPGATIDALKVYQGQMKDATQSRPMLVAHEAQEVAPYAVTGKKDAVNDDGTPKYQQIDVSSLVPLLIAEIQSLRARVAALEA
jgi:hypothetical protein